VRSIKEECLDRLIPLGERHLRRALTEFAAHYHRERNHQGLGKELIEIPILVRVRASLSDSASVVGVDSVKCSILGISDARPESSQRELRRDIRLVEEVLLDQWTEFVCPRMPQSRLSHRVSHQKCMADGVMSVEMLGERGVQRLEPPRQDQ
jgi:hypothetical protein